MKVRPLMFLPGTAFWALVIAGGVTGNEAFFYGAGAIAVIGVVTLGTLKARSSSAAKAETQRIWREGTAATAKIISIGTRGGGINDHPMVDFELEVTSGSGEPYRVTTSALVSKLAIPRIQPDLTIAVRVDPKDRMKIVVDSALTPYGYD